MNTAPFPGLSHTELADARPADLVDLFGAGGKKLETPPLGQEILYAGTEVKVTALRFPEELEDMPAAAPVAHPWLEFTPAGTERRLIAVLPPDIGSLARLRQAVASVLASRAWVDSFLTMRPPPIQEGIYAKKLVEGMTKQDMMATLGEPYNAGTIARLDALEAVANYGDLQVELVGGVVRSWYSKEARAQAAEEKAREEARLAAEAAEKAQAEEEARASADRAAREQALVAEEKRLQGVLEEIHQRFAPRVQSAAGALAERRSSWDQKVQAGAAQRDQARQQYAEARGTPQEHPAKERWQAAEAQLAALQAEAEASLAGLSGALQAATEERDREARPLAVELAGMQGELAALRGEPWLLQRPRALGVQLVHAPEVGVRVVQLSQDGEGAAAGLQVNDVVVAVQGKQVSSLRELAAELAALNSNATVRLQVRRGGESRDVSLVAASPREQEGPGQEPRGRQPVSRQPVAPQE